MTSRCIAAAEERLRLACSGSPVSKSELLCAAASPEEEAELLRHLNDRVESRALLKVDAVFDGQVWPHYYPVGAGRQGPWFNKQAEPALARWQAKYGDGNGRFAREVAPLPDGDLCGGPQSGPAEDMGPVAAARLARDAVAAIRDGLEAERAATEKALRALDDRLGEARAAASGAERLVAVLERELRKGDDK